MRVAVLLMIMCKKTHGDRLSGLYEYDCEAKKTVKLKNRKRHIIKKQTLTKKNSCMQSLSLIHNKITTKIINII